MDALDNSEPGGRRLSTVNGSQSQIYGAIFSCIGIGDTYVRGLVIECSGSDHPVPEWVRGNREARPGLR